MQGIRQTLAFKSVAEARDGRNEFKKAACAEGSSPSLPFQREVNPGSPS